MFEKATNSTLYQNVVAQVCAMIRDGSISKGSLLPSESALCQQLQVSRTTVREALAILARSGVIRTIRGKGSVVIADDFEYLEEELRVNIVRYESTFEYASQARQLLEPAIAALAARVATADDLEALQGVLDQCRRKEEEGSLATEDLRAFHLRLAAATHNPLLPDMVESLIRLCDAPPDTKLCVPNPGQREWGRITARHEDILAALRAHNEEEASFCMKANLRDFHDNSLGEY